MLDLGGVDWLIIHQMGEHLVPPSERPCYIPFNILTATVVQVAFLLMPNAAALTTLPNAPRPIVGPNKKIQNAIELNQTNDKNSCTCILVRHTIVCIFKNNY